MFSLPEEKHILWSGSCNEMSDGFMRNITDGAYLMGHPFLHDHPNAFLFALYTDDFECMNPIGSQRKKT